MAKRTTVFAAESPGLAGPSAPDAGGPAEPLEQRVQRLEDAVASLQDTRPLEERIVERVTERLSGKPAERAPEPVEHMITADRRTPAPPAEDGFAAARDLAPPPAPPPAPLMRHAWLLFDLLAELRAMVRMFFDVRYHVAWSTRLTVLILLVLIFLSGWWSPLSWVPVLGTLIDKLLDLVLAFFVYKALSREARRYLEVKGASTNDVHVSRS